jgi:hypothetical protein
VVDIELHVKVNVPNHKLLTSFLTLPKIFNSYSPFQFNIYGTLRNYFCYLKSVFSPTFHLSIFFLITRECLAIVVVLLIFKLHVFQMNRIVEHTFISDSSCDISHFYRTRCYIYKMSSFKCSWVSYTRHYIMHSKVFCQHQYY